VQCNLLVIERQVLDFAQDRPRRRIIALTDDRGLAEREHGEIFGIAVKDRGVMALATIDDVDATTDLSLPVFVSRTEAQTPEQRDRFGKLGAFIKAGGSVVYLQGAGSKAPWARAGKAPVLLPVRVRLKPAIGLWVCMPHIVHEHPIFDGLPVNGMMGPMYENIWAQVTLLDVRGETVAGTVGYDFSPDFELSKRHYYGPGDAWWGSDMAIVPVGRGRCILSQLRLVENLGKDPVADKVFYNLMNLLQ